MSVTYYKSASQPAFSVAVTASLPVWERVLPEPNAKVVFRQTHQAAVSYYTPLTLNTVYSAGPVTYGVPATTTYYLVAEDNFRDMSGGMLSFERQWAAVPTTWFDREDFPFNYPGYVVPISIGTRYLSSAPTEWPTYYTIPYTPSNISAGDRVYLDGSYTRNSISYRVNLFTTANDRTAAGIWVGVPKILPGTGTFSSGGLWVRRAAQGRAQPETIVVPSMLQNDYALTSVTQMEVDLPAMAQFTPVDSLGNSVSYLSTGTATAPNSSEYETAISTNSNLIAECIRERWLGNIYVRRIRLVPAQ